MLKADPDELMRRAFPLHEAGNLPEAERLYREIVSVAPDYADAHYLLGRIAQDRGELEAAVRHVREAVRHRSGEAQFQKTLGELHFNLGHFQEAAVYLQNAAGLQPDDYEIWNNLGCVAEKLDQTAQAAAYFRRALDLSQSSPAALNNTAIGLKDSGRPEEALALLQRVRGITPDDPEVFSNYLYQVNLTPGVTAEHAFAEHRAFDDRFGTGRFGRAVRRATEPDPDRRLRIGYFSPDLRSHPVSCFIEGPLAKHDRTKTEVFCYFLHPYGDVVSERLRKLADHWIECRGLSDEQIASRIADDRIDILVDLAGHTAGNRLPVLARKPAPVIVTWLGYPNTTGMQAVDYRITDAASDPPGATERFHTESLVRLAAQWCYARPDVPGDVTPLPATRHGYVRFASFNNSAKVTDALATAWASILARVPGSRLLLWGIEGEHAARLQQLFAGNGIDAARLAFSPRTSFPKQIAMYQETDIALDTFPYSGTTTTFNSLWMGVPVVTLAGDRSASRASHAILSGLGLADWSATSTDEYVAIAVRKAQDTSSLAELRSRLRDTLLRSAFMDAAGFTRALEHAYRTMWREHCAAGGGQRP